MKLNEKLKQLREDRGLSQAELASKLYVARQTVSKWEQGIRQPDLDTIKKICNILQCSLDELIDDNHEIINNNSNQNHDFKKIIKKVINISLYVGTFIFLIIGIIFVTLSLDRFNDLFIKGLTNGSIQTSFVGSVLEKALKIQKLFLWLGVSFLCISFIGVIIIIIKSIFSKKNKNV